MYRNVIDIDCMIFLTHCASLSNHCRHVKIDLSKQFIHAQFYTSIYIESVLKSYSIVRKATGTDEIIEREKIGI